MAPGLRRGYHEGMDAEHPSVIVVGGSMGAWDALVQICGRLPLLDVAILVVLHIAPDAGDLAGRLARGTAWPVAWGEDAQRIVPGRICLAPPDQHMWVRAGVVCLGRGPRENRHRPAIDRLFRSAAASYGDRVVGAILSGSGDDGVAGMLAIRATGGTTIVQAPDDAVVATLPRLVMASVPVDYSVATDQLPGLLQDIVTGTPVSIPRLPPPVPAPEPPSLIQPTLSGFTCPMCHGVLWELTEKGLLRFQCTVGHLFSPESLAAQTEEELEAALWAAMRALDDSARLERRLEAAGRFKGSITPLGQRHAENALGKEAQVALLRQMLLSRESAASSPGQGFPDPGPNAVAHDIQPSGSLGLG